MKRAVLFLLVMFFFGCGSSDNGESKNDVDIATLSVYATSGSASGVSVSDGYAYVAAENAGLQIIDISDPENPVWTGECATPGPALDVSVSDGYAYVAAENAGLQIIDISDPENPVRTGECATPGPALHVSASIGYAYVAAGDEGLQFIDTSDPENPFLIVTHYTNTRICDFCVSEDHLYTAMGSVDGFWRINMSDPENPFIDGIGMTGHDGPFSVHVSGNFAYLTSGYAAVLYVYDISDAEDMDLSGIGELHPRLRLNDVYVSNNYAYVDAVDDGLAVFDVSDPAQPWLAGTCALPGYIEDVCAAGNIAYLAVGEAGLIIVEVSD